MKWTAIDLGQAEIKAAVCNTSSNKPERLVYNEGLSYSYMPHGVVVSNDEVYIGHQVLLLAAMGVDGVVSKINESPFNEKILNKIFSTIRNASEEHYADSMVGAVLLFDDATSRNNIEKAIYEYKDKGKVIDSVIARIALDTFSEVTCVCSSEAISSMYVPNQTPSLIVDLGHSALKISIVANGKQVSFHINEKLGFKEVDLSDIVGYDFTLDVSDAERILFGKYLSDVVKLNLIHNHSNYYPLPIFKDVTKGKTNIQNIFDAEMARYLYKCLDYCNCLVQKTEWRWNNIGSIIFCGGAANYHLLSHTFENYRKDYGIVNAISVKTFCKDAEWISAFSAMQLPLDRNSSSVIVEY